MILSTIITDDAKLVFLISTNLASLINEFVLDLFLLFNKDQTNVSVGLSKTRTLIDTNSISDASIFCPIPAKPATGINIENDIMDTVTAAIFILLKITTNNKNTDDTKMTTLHNWLSNKVL